MLEGFSPPQHRLAPAASQEPVGPVWQHRTGHSDGQAGTVGSVPYPGVTNREMSACVCSLQVAEASSVPGLPPVVPTVPPPCALSGVQRSSALRRDTKLGDFSLALAPGEGPPVPG